MVNIIGLLYRLASFLRVVCAGYQVADAVANLSKMVAKMDRLEARVETLAEQLGENAYGPESLASRQSGTGGD